MPLLWASCLFRPAKGTSASLEVNSATCPPELQEQLALRGTGCLRPRGAHILYERVDDAGQGAFTPPVVIYIKRLPICSGLEVCVKRTLITHFVGRAAREARLQVQLHHPHLLPALASVRGRHHYYLVLPAAEGDLWAEVEALRQQGSGYSERELRDVARQILEGLDHLHASHLAHRDIKPANVLRMPDGRVVVADFGCADGCTTGFVAAGTTQFQPPECRRNSGAQLAVLPKGYDQRLQDMWSVGATLAALWFARMPEVIRGGGTSRVPAAAAAVAAVAAGAGGGAGGPGGDGTATASVGARRGSSNGSTNSNSSSSGGASTGCTHVNAAAATAAAAATTVSSTASTGSAAATAGTRAGAPGLCACETVAVPAAPPARPPSGQLPRFLAGAGFGACPSTVGACGELMSAELQDLLARLLRLRPSERLTARQALQHDWMRASSANPDAVRNQLPYEASVPHATTAPAAVGLDGVEVAVAPEGVLPEVSTMAAAAVTAEGVALAAEASALASAPMARVMRTPSSNMCDGGFKPFSSQHDLRMRPSATAAPAAPATNPASAADGLVDCESPPSAAANGRNPLENQLHCKRHQQQQQQLQQQHSGCVGGNSSSSTGSSSNSSSASAAASLPSGGQQRHPCFKGVQALSPAGHGQSHSPGDSNSSTASSTSRSPGEQAEQLALRQQQQRQQQQSSSTWLLRPSSQAHNPKRAQRAILRVFVGAGGESSGSN